MALTLAILIGVISAVRQRTITDYTLTVLTYVGISIPAFLLGLFLQDIFGVWLHWLPTSGTGSYGYALSPVESFVDQLQHLILPVTALSILFIAGWSRYMRSSMIEVVKQDYMRTARAKGVRPVRLYMRHALRNAVIHLITIVALNFAEVAGGTTITEGVVVYRQLKQA